MPPWADAVHGGYRLPQATRKVPAKPAVESKNPTLLCSRVGFLIKCFVFYCLLDRGQLNAKANSFIHTTDKQLKNAVTGSFFQGNGYLIKNTA